MSDEQPEALMLVKGIDDVVWFSSSSRAWGESVAAELRRLHEVNQELVEALERLAKLGNGDHYGNSVGNEIAKAALAKAKGETE